jgi:hypothetical protein
LGEAFEDEDLSGGLGIGDDLGDEALTLGGEDEEGVAEAEATGAGGVAEIDAAFGGGAWLEGGDALLLDGVGGEDADVGVFGEITEGEVTRRVWRKYGAAHFGKS